MADMGLETAFGNASMEQALRQRMLDQIAEQQRQRDAAQQQFTNTRLTANDARVAEEHAANMKMLADAHAASQHQNEETDAAKIAPSLSINQSIPAPIAGRLRGTMQAANMADNPPLAQPPNMPDMMQPDIVPGQQPGAVWKGNDAQRSTEDDKQKLADVMNDPTTTPQVKAFIRMRGVMPKGENIPYQLITEPNGPPRAPGQPVQVGPSGIFTSPADAIGKPAYHPPQQTATVTIQTVDDKGNPVTRVVPKSEALGQSYAKPESAQAAEHTRTNKETLDTLNQLDQAIDGAKDLIGPGMGRVSNLEQMAGSADPRIQALGVKMKAAKMRVDHALTGSVRAGASPSMLAQWDNILANKVTSEGLKAGVQAMREILNGGSATSASGAVEKWTRDANGNLVKQ